MNRKSTKERAKILQLLTEGNSLRATSRLAECSINTVMKLLVDVGDACAWYQDTVFQDLPCTRVQVDEIWSFVYAKRKNVRDDMEQPAGDVWTWTSICQDTKLVPCWAVGPRNAATAKEFIADLAGRMGEHIQLTSDGFAKYKDAVEDAFGADVDYAMLVKIYGEPRGKRFGQYEGYEKRVITGNPDMDNVSTNIVERQNLTMRMSMRRFTRKSNGFSKKIENHAYATALHFMNYNFVRIHGTLKTTPAMAAGITDRLWSLEDVIELTNAS